MPKDLNFNGRVAVVTGSGNGLGRAHALLLASRGAKVVINDYGPNLIGSGQSSKPADDVVAEIQAAGGQAVANYDGVQTREGCERIIQGAVRHFGRIDILVCNAGILKNERFGEQSEENWRRHLSVHLDGSMYAAWAAWPHMKRAGYGRIVFTASGGGLYGVAGLTAYGAAKAGIYGLTRCLAQETEEDDGDLRVNCVLPAAATRMLSQGSRDKMGKALDKGDPALVSPIVAYLASEECPENGKTYSAGAGFFALEQVVQCTGYRFGHTQPIAPEQLAAKWAEINDTRVRVTFNEARENGARIFADT